METINNLNSGNDKMKQSAHIKFRSIKTSEKAILISKQLKIDFPDPFTIKVSAFVPKADIKKPMPKLAVTVDVADDKVRFVSGSVEELIDFHLNVAQWLNENKNALEDAVSREATAWVELQQAFLVSKQQIKLRKVS